MKSQHGIGHLFASDLVKNSAKLLSANVAAQAIGLLAYPILTRIYAPEDFGLLNLFLSIGGVLALLATAEYQYAIVLPKEDTKGIACLHIGAFTTLCLTALCTLTIPFSKPIANLFSAPNLAKWWWLMPVFVLVTALWTLLNYWYTRQKRFGNISAYQITQSSLSALSKIGFGVAGFTAFGLIVSSIIAPLAALAAAVGLNFKRQIRRLLHFDRAACREAAKEYANFPKFSLPRALVNSVSSNLPVLLLTPFFNLTEIGYFGMAVTLSFTPISLITKSLHQVFFQRTTERVNQRASIAPFFRKLIRNTLLMVVPAFALLYFALPALTGWLLGDGWQISGKYIQLMLPWLAVCCIGNTIGYIPDIFMQQKISAIIEFVYCALRVIALLVGIWAQSFPIAILCYSTVCCIVVVGQIIWYMRLIARYEKQIRP